jgi:hypothetical protein
MIRESGGVEAVAYALFERICFVEKKDIGAHQEASKGWERPSRSWILSTYAECLRAAGGVRSGTASPGTEAHIEYAGRRVVPREAIMASDPI